MRSFLRGLFFNKQMRNIDFALTLMESAQVFHWQFFSGIYAAAVNGSIMFNDDETPQAKHYFDDDRDYGLLIDDCRKYEQAALAMKRLAGLRVLNQPTWETVAAFILSSNNNVSRIRNLVSTLCRVYGERLTRDGITLHGFPSPAVLAAQNPDDLKRVVTCGYRAAYLVETANMVNEGFDLDALRSLTLESAKKELMRLKGVGPKVADCILLFGCGHADAFPVDVWVARLMDRWFHVTGTEQKVSDKAREMFGPRCGLIQQALFHAARTGIIEV